MNSENTGSTEVIGALLVGAAIGALVGILFAPDKGSNTRKKIFKGASGIAGDLKDKIQDSVEELKSKYEDMKGEAEETYEEVKKTAKDKVENLKQDAKVAASNARA